MRQYKSIILTLLVALFFGLNANAQGSERAVATKIGDALNMLPAETQKKYNQLMGDIAETGAEGIKMLLGYLNKQDDTRRLAEYAINGYVSFVADPKFDAQKRQIVIDAVKAEYESICKQLTGDNIKDSQTKPLLVSNKEFLVRQLQFLGVIKAPVEAEEAPADAKTLAKNLKAASKLEPNFANNAAMAVVLMPVVLSFSTQLGINPIPVAMGVTLMVFVAMLTPAASPHAGMMHGRKDIYSTGEILKIGFPMCLITWALYVFVGYPLMKLLLGIA